MINCYYNLILFSDSTQTPRRIQIPKKVVKVFLSLFLVSTIVFSIASYYFYTNYFSLRDKVVELHKMREENKQQRVQLHKLSKKISGFEDHMDQMENFDRKLRIITALQIPEANGPKGNLGLGGSNPKEFKNSYDHVWSYNSVPLTDHINEDLEKLIFRSELQEISFVELDEFFKNQSSLLSSTPSIWPTRGWVTSGFGYRISPFTTKRQLHDGVDIAAPSGSPVFATANGVVIRSDGNRSYGNMVEVDHGYGVVTRYGHNSKNYVSVGDNVKRGQIIAEVGSTGRSTGPHLHYEVALNGVPVNPLRYIIEEGKGEF